MKSRGVYLVAGAVTLLLVPLLFHGQDVNITPRPIGRAACRWVATISAGSSL